MFPNVDRSCYLGRCHLQCQFRSSRSPDGVGSGCPRSVQQIYEVQIVPHHTLLICTDDSSDSFNPQNPDWLNRDRFVLSNGHACMLQYALLHLFGYKLTMDDIKAFRVSAPGSNPWSRVLPDKFI